MKIGTILDTIGFTPMVEIVKLNPNPDVRILAKIEGSNPPDPSRTASLWR